MSDEFLIALQEKYPVLKREPGLYGDIKEEIARFMKENKPGIELGIWAPGKVDSPAPILSIAPEVVVEPRIDATNKGNTGVPAWLTPATGSVDHGKADASNCKCGHTRSDHEHKRSDGETDTCYCCRCDCNQYKKRRA